MWLFFKCEKGGRGIEEGEREGVVINRKMGKVTELCPFSPALSCALIGYLEKCIAGT